MSCTILIPTHNRPGVLPDAVASALAGCPTDGEVLVVDDRSDPPAAQALGAVNDPRLRIIPSDRTPGAAGARNTGIHAAANDVILFLDDDDLMADAYPRRVVEIARAHPELTYGLANHRRHDLTTGRIDQEALPFDKGPLAAKAPLRQTLVSAGRGLWVRRAALIEVGGFDETQVIDEDTSLSIRLRLAGFRAYFDPTPGVITQLNGTGAQGDAPQLTTSQTARQYDAYLATYQTFASRFGALSPERWFLLTRFLRRAAKLGRGRNALAVAQAHRPAPVALCALVYLANKMARHRKTSALAKE